MVASAATEKRLSPAELDNQRHDAWHRMYLAAKKAAIEAYRAPEEVTAIHQHPKSGLWCVARPVMVVEPAFDHLDEIAAWQFSHRHMRFTDPAPLPPPPDSIDVTASTKWVDYEPKFDTFAEAHAWAQETTLLGAHPVKLTKDGLLAPGAGLEVLEALAAAKTQRDEVAKAAMSRITAYQQDAQF